MVTSRRLGCAVAVLLAAGAPRPATAQAQDDGQRIIPTHNVLLSGYGTVGYVFRTQGDNENEFTAALSPIFLYQFQDKIMFEAELEFELEEGITETGLEYAQVDFVANDNLVLVGGKFLLPFGEFGERLHPTWINKFPSAPPIYGHHVSEFGAEPILPILSDVGVMAKGTVRPGPAWITLDAYVTQGPALEEDGAEEVPEFHFPASSGDNNINKMVGGRLTVALPPTAQLYFSGFNGDYDDDGVLDLTGWNVAGSLHYRDLDMRAEYVQTRQEVETFDGFPTLRKHGFYAQAAYRVGPWEPVFRWTQVFDTKLDGEVEEEGAWQAAFGIDYWFGPSIAFMVGYEVNREDGPELDNDRILAHFAFGF